MGQICAPLSGRAIRTAITVSIASSLGDEDHSLNINKLQGELETICDCGEQDEDGEQRRRHRRCSSRRKCEVVADDIGLQRRRRPYMDGVLDGLSAAGAAAFTIAISAAMASLSLLSSPQLQHFDK